MTTHSIILISLFTKSKLYQSSTLNYKNDTFATNFCEFILDLQVALNYHFGRLRVVLHHNFIWVLNSCSEKAP